MTEIVRWLIKKTSAARKVAVKNKPCRGPRTCVPVADDDLAGDVELHSLRRTLTVFRTGILRTLELRGVVCVVGLQLRSRRGFLPEYDYRCSCNWVKWYPAFFCSRFCMCSVVCTSAEYGLQGETIQSTSPRVAPRGRLEPS